LPVDLTLEALPPVIGFAHETQITRSQRIYHPMGH
jgi:hypothetical protein